MVTRRAVLKGTAAASIGAIAAAHGAVPAEAAALDIGYGQLTGGAVGGFSKFRDAFQVAVKFDKYGADIFIKEAVDGSVEVFSKFFDKTRWTATDITPVGSIPFSGLTDLYFSKIDSQRAEFFLKDRSNRAIVGTIDTTTTDSPMAFAEWTPPPTDCGIT